MTSIPRRASRSPHLPSIPPILSRDEAALARSRSPWLHAAVALAMSLATLCVAGLTRNPWFWVGPVVMATLLETVAVLCRRRGWDDAEVQGVQALMAIVEVIGFGAVAAHLSNPEGHFPGSVLHLFRDSITVVQTTWGTLPTSLGLVWLATSIVAVLTVVADLLVITLETPAWSVVPIFAIHLAPALAVAGDAPWWSFVLVAVAWLTILATDRAVTLHRPGVAGPAVVVTALTVCLALLGANALPLWGHLDLSRPTGNPSAPVRMTDPTVNLRRNLNNRSTASVLSYVTNSPDGEYMRLASLPRVSSTGWSLVPVDLASRSPGSVPGLIMQTHTRTVDVSVHRFASQYLPSPYAPISADVDSTWAWDPDSLAIISTSADHSHATVDLQYTLTVSSPDPDPATFDDTGVGTPSSDVYREVPGDVPRDIVELTHRITDREGTPVRKARAIQSWLRDTSRFSYDTTAPEGDGYQVLENFLLHSHRGYCIHFAAAMALMARIDGIPSRVSVGFLPGTMTHGVWNVQARQMHAWPELYLDGYGWVRFEPTAAVAPEPSWTREPGTTATPTPSASTSSATPTPSASPTPTSSSTPEPTAAVTPTASPAPTVPDRGGSSPGAGWVLVVLAVLIVLSIPVVVRACLARRRIRRGTPAAAWREVRAVWVDHGLQWPGGTPRQQVGLMGAGMDPGTREALGRLGLAEEQSLWSAADGTYPGIREDLTTVRRWVASSPGHRPHWLACLLPRSLFHR